LQQVEGAKGSIGKEAVADSVDDGMPRRSQQYQDAGTGGVAS
jgi:hypothetical protein